MQTSITFYFLWLVAFLGFPLGGLAARLLVGPAENALRGLLSGLVTGAIIGLAEWMVLRQAIPISVGWVAATALGMAVGLAVGIAVTGTSTEGNSLLIRAAITGFGIGIAQWLLLRAQIPMSEWWIGVIAVSWILGWFVTRAVGVDLSQQWSVFGASGALVFQIITALTLWRLLP